MSTLVCDRNESNIEFEQQAKEIVTFLLKNSHRFPKSTRFIYHTKLLELSYSLLENVEYSQAVYFTDKKSKIFYVQKALGCLNTLEILWNIVHKTYEQQISVGLYEELGRHILLEREKLLALLKSLRAKVIR